MDTLPGPTKNSYPDYHGVSGHFIYTKVPFGTSTKCLNHEYVFVTYINRFHCSDTASHSYAITLTLCFVRSDVCMLLSQLLHI